MRIFICFLLVCTAGIFSCTHEKPTPPSYSMTWCYNANQDLKQQLENNRFGGNKEYDLDGANFIDLQPDSSFTSYLSSFSFGHWNFHDSMLMLTDHHGRVLPLEVKKMTESELVCLNIHNGNIYRFNGYPNRFPSGEENPFSIHNNQWRIPATHRETDVQIRDRLKNHFHFWEKYFNWALQNKLTQLEVRSIPTLLDMYSNGFNLQYYDYQPKEWKRIFFDSTDSWKAYEKVYYLMAAKRVKWPVTKNKFERFVSAFQQMQLWLDKK